MVPVEEGEWTVLKDGIVKDLVLGDGGFLHPDSPILKTLQGNTTAADKVAQNAVCLSVTIRRFGVRRKASTELIDTEADKSMIYLGKEILDSAELKAIQSLHNEVRAFLKKKAIPGALLKSGLYLIPISLVEDIDEKIEGFKKKEKGLVDKFLDVYPEQVKEAEQRLKGLFSPGDYPPVEKLRACFGIETQLLAINVPNSLKEINAEIWKREQEKFELQWQETLTEVREGLREGLAGMVDHLIDRLGDTPEGKRKRFHASTITNLKDFLDVFDSRNITSDSDLKDIVGKAKQLIQGVEPDDLRKHQPLRDVVLDGLTQVKKELDGLATSVSTRKYKLDG